MAGYSYTKLDDASAEIRLVTLDPAGSSWDAPITCSLQHHSLDAAPSYDALSYLWGPTTDQREINVGGARCSVTSNLYVALGYLRYDTAPRTLWIDALCINQNDLGERAEQVQRMRDIYSGAATVLAWTGETSEDSTEALILIADFGKFVYQWLLSRPAGQEMREGDGGRDAMRAHGFEPEGRNWPAMWRFWKRPYWSRVWVAQELACGFAKSYSDWQRCWVLCGEICIPFMQHAFAAYYFEQILKQFAVVTFETDGPAGTGLAEPALSFEREQAAMATGAVQMMTVLLATRLERPTICQLLIPTFAFQATDVRDKIFAMLGLSSEHGHFLPDYTSPPEKVYRDFTRFLIRSFGAIPGSTKSQLEVLCGNRGGDRHFTTSWVPDPYPMAGFPVSDNRAGAGGLRCLPGDTMAASGDDDDDAVLNLRGIVVGTVDICTTCPDRERVGAEMSPPSGMFVPLTRTPSMTQFIHELQLLAHSFSEDDATWDRFWRTLVQDRDVRSPSNTKYPAPEEFGAMAKVTFHITPLPPDYMPEASWSSRYAHYAGTYDSLYILTLAERCFFTTRQGHMGIGPHGAKSGDLVVVLLGGTACFVLRPKDNDFELVGDAYVHGLMDGQMLELLEEGKVESRMFSLR